MDRAMEVGKGVHRLAAPLGDRDDCLYLLWGEDAALLVDTGIDGSVADTLVPHLEREELDPSHLRWVVNTHCDFDHVGGNAAVRDLAPHAVICCHELDRPLVEDVEALITRRYGEFAADHGIDESPETQDAIRGMTGTTPVDVGLAGGEVFRLGADWHVEVLHTPGHSSGHVSVHDPRSQSVIVGDAVLGDTLLTRDGAPAFPPTYRDVDTYLASIRRLEGLRVETLLTAHYPVYRRAAAVDFLAGSRAFVDEVDRALRDALSTGEPRTMRALVDELAPRLGSWSDAARDALVYPFTGHLERLERLGAVARIASGTGVAYRWQR